MTAEPLLLLLLNVIIVLYHGVRACVCVYHMTKQWHGDESSFCLRYAFETVNFHTAFRV